MTDQAGVRVPEQQSGGNGHGGPRRGHGHGRPGQGRPGQGRPGQGRPGQGRAGQGRYGQGGSRDGRPGQDRYGRGRQGPGQDKRGSRGAAGNRDADRERRRRPEPGSAAAQPRGAGRHPLAGQRRGSDGRRPDARSRASRPEIPADVTAGELDPDVRRELRSLPRDLADLVARHLATAQRAQQQDDAETAYQHAHAARTLASRIGVVRETCGVAAYLAGRWAEALAELRAARRMTGRNSLLPMMADCERALGRPERALALVTGPDARAADRGVQIELRIVESGIRRDMGAADVAVVTLQVPELTDGRQRPWSARLYYAYADALLDADRAEEALEWFARAAAADVAGETDAASRFDDLDEVIIEDLEEA